KSARNFPRSLTSPSHSVLTNLSSIMLAMAEESRTTWAWFHMRSSATSLPASADETSLEDCANAQRVTRRQQTAAFLTALPFRFPTLLIIDCDTIARRGLLLPSKTPLEHYQCHAAKTATQVLAFPIRFVLHPTQKKKETRPWKKDRGNRPSPTSSDGSGH